MDFGGGFATGMAVGIGTGVASGTSAGATQSKKRLREYIEENGIEMHDRYGKPIKLDDFMDEALPCSSSSCCSGKKAWLFAVLVAAVVIALAAVFVMRSAGSF